MTKKIIVASLGIIIILINAAVVFAADTDTHYVIGGRGRKQIPVAYNVDKVYSIFGTDKVSLNNPQDLFIDDNDNIHILDTGNSRIVVMNNEGSILKEIIPSGKGALKNPYGLFVDHDGSYLIADTDNKRIAVLDSDGVFVEEFIQPISPLYDTSYPFKPKKVALDSQGQIYVLNNDDFHGFIKMNAYNEFLGYIASTRITSGIWDALVERFASSLQQQLIGTRLPAVHTNIYMMPDNTFYATTARTSGDQLKHFTAVGSNIYPSGSFGDAKSDYVTEYFSGSSTEDIRFEDICVDDKGIISAIDGASGRIFQYDQDGSMLAAFGGTGNWSGRFRRASAIDVDSQGRIFVLDSSLGNIQSFKSTGFMETVHTALNLYMDGKYEAAKEPWEEILASDRSYYVAHLGMGKVFIKREMWKDAMAEYKFIANREGYSLAFSGIRKDFVRSNFLLIIFTPVILAAALLLLLGRLGKTAKRTQSEGIVTDLSIPLNVIYSPWDGFTFIKRDRDRFSYKAPTLILLVFLISQIVKAFIEHYPLAAMEVQYRNFIQEMTIVLIPFFTWVIALYLVTSIMDGESKLREIYAATAYALLPAALLIIPLSAASNLMSLDESGLYRALWFLVYGWCALLVFISISAMNTYTLKQTLVRVGITIFTCIFIWCVGGLIYILMNKMFTFLYDIYLQNKLYFIG